MDAILLFLKHPTPGLVKTRLAATVGVHAATAIYKEMVSRVCSSLPSDATPIVVFDPPECEAGMRAWLNPLLATGVAAHFVPQPAGDLGARIQHGFEYAFSAGFLRVAAIGSDCIDLHPGIFAETFSHLSCNDAVFGPAWDGGYYLVALARPIPELFQNIAWSCERTLADSLERAKDNALAIFLLEKRHDVDTEEDWLRAKREHHPMNAMKLTTPIVFEPLFMERVWGGRRLESLFGKKLPHGARVGESWEVVDREEAQSVVHNGVLRGKTLHELWTDYREPVFGAKYAAAGPRFPLLFKLLDAEERLSVQVHPPAAIAPELKGEPKTEMWYIAWAEADADIFAGLAAGATRESFEESLATGQVADLLHRIPTHTGDCIFIPSGRLHAIGAGNVIVEVQQNSDTTYRVFDWNRVGLDGKPRALHIEESLRSTDFDDFEPKLQERDGSPLVRCDYFRIEKLALDTAKEVAPLGDFAIVTCLTGKVRCVDEEFGPGSFFVVPASLENRAIEPLAEGTSVLSTRLP